MDWNHHIYINLDKRGGRNTKTIKQLMKLGITKPNRFSAIEHEYGIIGCALSHIKVIENAIDKELPYICVFEDDIDIIEARTSKSKVDRLIENTSFLLFLFFYLIILGRTGPSASASSGTDGQPPSQCSCQPPVLPTGGSARVE